MKPALPLTSRPEQGSCLFPPSSGPPVMAPCHAFLPVSRHPSGTVGPQSSVGHLSPAQAILHQESARGTLWPVNELLVSLSPASTHTCSRSPLVPRGGRSGSNHHKSCSVGHGYHQVRGRQMESGSWTGLCVGAGTGGGISQVPWTFSSFAGKC